MEASAARGPLPNARHTGPKPQTTHSRPLALADGKEGVSGSSPELGFVKAWLCLDASQRLAPVITGATQNNAQLL